MHKLGLKALVSCRNVLLNGKSEKAYERTQQRLYKKFLRKIHRPDKKTKARFEHEIGIEKILKDIETGNMQTIELD